MIAVSVSEVFEAQTFSNFFRFPMVFLCGLFIPVQALPIFLQPLSYLAPLTHGVDVLSIAVNHNGHIPLPISFAALVIFSLVAVRGKLGQRQTSLDLPDSIISRIFRGQPQVFSLSVV
jgi:ABC-type multidrug transport system permease subunit